jgi:hypothetical protein
MGCRTVIIDEEVTMKKTIFAFAIVGVASVGCAQHPKGDWVAGFNPPDAPAGYTRYITPKIENIMPGANLEYCSWVAAAGNTDVDVLALDGYQSPTGHHAVLYSSTEDMPVGETHLCTVQDMISISFLGAIGGEGTGTSAAALPDGLFFRLPRNHALMINSHWLNATDKVVEGQAVLDIKTSPASNDHVIADLFANNADNFTIPANGTATHDVSCTLTQDLNFAMVTNHMHTHGTSVYTELVHPDHTTQMLIQDLVWQPEEQFNPRYNRVTVAAPIVAHAGDVYHTHCEWANTTASPLMFPDEMCTGVGFYFPSVGAQLICDNGAM